MSPKLELTGLSEELKSPRALKVLACAISASVGLSRSEVSSVETLQSKTPMAKSLVLTVDEKLHIATVNSMMRAVASLVPSSGLLGATDADRALIDGWLSFIWSSLELPIEVLIKDNQTKACSNDLSSALGVINRHLLYRTYMVGEGVTLADIALVAVLHNALSHKLWEKQKVENVARCYDTLVHQPFFQQALRSLESASSSVGVSESSTGEGVMLNGVPTAVVNRKYRRNRVRIKEVLANEGGEYMNQTITVAGWARTTRNANKGQILFVELSDGSSGTTLQCVLDANTTEGFDECKASGGTGASFQMVGTVIESPAKGQAVEMQVKTGKLLGAVYGGNAEGTQVGGMLYPMSKKEHTMEHMRECAHLRPRGRIHSATMRVRHAMAFATHNFFHNHGFLYIHTPIITGADCEGAGEQFAVTTLLGSDHLKPDVKLPVHEPPPVVDESQMSKKELKRLKKKEAASKTDPNKPQEEKVVGAVDYGQDFFAHRVNLTVSGQLNVETHACALSDVYTFGPTFRAEESRTYRHLAEFWMIEPEIAFADLTDDIDLAEDYLKYCVKFALERCADDIEFFETMPHGEPGLRDRLRNVLDNPFKRLSYTEAIKILQKAVDEGASFEEKPEWGIDLPSEHERYLCEVVFKQPVVLYDYPKDIKAFYMKLNEDEKTVAAADILVPKIGEIIGGSQREHRLDVLRRRCVESGLDPRNVWWYLDLRRYGTVPHAGFGLGFERLILFITGLQNIRDVIPFPRWVGNAEF